jgi:4-carboxymuconolactone decarboxylase
MFNAILLPIGLAIMTAVLGDHESSLAAETGKQAKITRAGAPKPAQAEHFTGSVQLSGAFQADAPGRAGGATVTFSPGARTDWHTHPLGQTLVITEGIGRIRIWGGAVQEVRKGDVVWIPAGLKHWHGAGPTGSMTHIAIAERQDDTSVQWMEKVNDEQYGGQAPPKASSVVPKEVTEFAPKLAQLTDVVLFMDVWERPELSKRDRSLVTVSILIANGSTEQLRGHFLRARDNGLTESEIIEAITHSSFYAGWPRAMTALTVAREIFKK